MTISEAVVACRDRDREVKAFLPRRRARRVCGWESSVYKKAPPASGADLRIPGLTGNLECLLLII